MSTCGQELCPNWAGDSGCPCAVLGIPPDAPDEWVVYNGMGGYICSVCGDPVESEPCPEHKPDAYARCIGTDRTNGSEETR